MLESFGARLRQRREEQAIALVTIAEQTKIKLSLLEALERDDVSHWPSGIFRRAFIRAYAHAIGLDPDRVVREFLEVHPEPAEVDMSAAAVAARLDEARVSGGPPTRLRNLVGSAIGSLARLRRSPAVEDLSIAHAAQATAPAAVHRDFSAAADAAHECVPASAEAAADPGAPVNEAVSWETELPAPLPETCLDERETCLDERAKESIADAPPADSAASVYPDFLAVADLCTEFARIENPDDVQPLLEEAARILDASGLIVWVWDPMAAELRAALVHGYSDKVLAQLPTVSRDADNMTAAAFRSAQTRVMKGTDRTSGALVVPLLTPAGCAGVLAIELQHGREQAAPVRAAATIFAALLAQFVGVPPAREVGQEAEVVDPPVELFPEPVPHATVRR